MQHRRVVKKTYGLTILIGNVTADSEFYLTRQGEPKIVFRLAIDRCFDFDIADADVAGRETGTDFFTVEAGGNTWVDLELFRGDRVMVVGVPRSRDTKTNGEQRVITYFQPLVIELLHRKDGGDPARYYLALDEKFWNKIRPGADLIQMSLALESRQNKKETTDD